MLVFVGHWYVLLGEEAPKILGGGLQGWGVRLLFLIGGYLAYNSISRSKNTDWRFVIKKLERILPPLWMCLLVTVCGLFFLSSVPSEYFGSAVKYVLSNSILIPRHQLAGVFEDNIYPIAVNGSLWTLPIEMLCFASIPFLYFIFVNINRCVENDLYAKAITGFLSFIVCFGIHILLMTNLVEKVGGSSPYTKNVLEVMLWFYVGVLIRKIDSLIVKKTICILALILCVIVRDSYYVFGAYIFGVVLDELVSLGNNINKKILLPPNIYYGMFLYGFPVQQAVINITKIKCGLLWPDWTLFICALVVDVILAVGSYQVVEKRTSSINILIKKIRLSKDEESK